MSRLFGRTGWLLISAAILAGAVVAGTMAGEKASHQQSYQREALGPGMAIAERSGTGNPAAIEIVYRVKGDKVPGAIVVYAYPADTAQKSERIAIDRIFQFAPAGPDGTFKVTVQIPPSVTEDLKNGDIVIEAMFDPDFTANLPALDVLSLEAARVIGSE